MLPVPWLKIGKRRPVGEGLLFRREQARYFKAWYGDNKLTEVWGFGVTIYQTIMTGAVLKATAFLV